MQDICAVCGLPLGDHVYQLPNGDLVHYDSDCIGPAMDYLCGEEGVEQCRQKK